MDTGKEARESITLEACLLVYGDREEAYGHPAPRLRRTGQFWTTWLGDKLRPGAEVDAHDVGVMMCLEKVSRQRSRPRRDNLTDLCGWAENAQRVLDAQPVEVSEDV